MAYALKIPAIEIDALDAIALQIASGDEDVHVILDAYRGQVFHACYSKLASSCDDYQKISETEIVDINQLLSRFSSSTPGSQATVLCGPGCGRLQKFLADPESDFLSSPLVFERFRWLDGPETFPRAESVARLAFTKFIAGETVDAFHILPRYYRASAAEEMSTSKKLG